MCVLVHMCEVRRCQVVGAAPASLLPGVLSGRAGRQVWDHLHTLSTKYPVDGNRDGTYLTFFSIGGFIFGIINIIGNFGARS